MKAAVVGLGFGELHIQALLEIDEIDEIIICDLNEDLLKKKAEEYNISEWTTSFDDILKDSEVKIVTLAVPHFLHYDLLKKAVEAEKNIYCEKPLTINYQQGVEIYEKAREKGIKLTVGYNMRYYEQYIKAFELIKDNIIGDIFMVECHAYADASGMKGFRLSKEKAGGGCLIDSGAHRLDLLRWLIGPVTSVYMLGGTFKIDEMEGEDTAVVSLKFKDDIIGVLNCSWGVKVPDWDEGMKIYGTKGTLNIWDHDLSLSCRNNAGEEQIFKYTTTYENTIKLSLRDFIKSIKKNDFSIDREKVLDSLKIIDSAYKSFAENKIIKINY